MHKLLVAVALSLAAFGCKKEPDRGPPPLPEAGTIADAGAPPPPPSPTGVIRGAVKLTGLAPKMQPLRRGADPFCARTKVVDAQVRVKDGALRDAFVRVTQNPRAPEPPPAEPVKVEFRACVLEPRVQGAVQGQPVEVHNTDGTEHRVHGYAGRQTLWAEPLAPGAPPLVRQPSPGIVRVACDRHPWEVAYVIVSPHGWFDTTGEEGAFELRGLADGEYTLEAWHERYGTKAAAVTVQAGAAAAVEFTFSEADRL